MFCMSFEEQPFLKESALALALSINNKQPSNTSLGASRSFPWLLPTDRRMSERNLIESCTWKEDESADCCRAAEHTSHAQHRDTQHHPRQRPAESAWTKSELAWAKSSQMLTVRCLYSGIVMISSYGINIGKYSFCVLWFMTSTLRNWDWSFSFSEQKVSFCHLCV